MTCDFFRFGNKRAEKGLLQIARVSLFGGHSDDRRVRTGKTGTQILVTPPIGPSGTENGVSGAHLWYDQIDDSHTPQGLRMEPRAGAQERGCARFQEESRQVLASEAA